MRSLKIMFLFFIIFICFFGCKSLNNISLYNNNDAYSQEDQYCLEKAGLSSQTIAESPADLYFFSGPQNNYLFLIDKKTLKSLVLCNKPECLHYNEPDPAKKSNCNAFWGNSSENLIYNNGYLYILNESISPSSFGCSLYQVSLDSSIRKKIRTLKDIPLYLIIHNGYIYYSVSDYGTITGIEDKAKSTIKLYRINLNKITENPELVYEYSGIYASISRLIGYKDRIYFICTEYIDSQLKSEKGTLMAYYSSTDNVMEVSQNVGRFSICGDKIVYHWLDGYTYEINLDGSNKKRLDNINGLIYSDDKYIIVDNLSLILKEIVSNSKTDIKRTISIYNIDGLELQKLNIAEFINVYAILGSDLNYIYIIDKGSQSNQYGNIDRLYIINKSDIGNGTARLEEIFEFVPKIEDVGYLTKTE